MDLTRGIPVRVQLETWVTQEGQQEHHQFDEPGQLARIGETLYIRYVEPGEEQMQVTVKVKPGAVELSRRNASDTTRLHLEFVAGKEVVAQYRTPYGLIPVSTVTPQLDVAIEEETGSGQIDVTYRLTANGDHLGDYRLHLLFNA